MLRRSLTTLALTTSLVGGLGGCTSSEPDTPSGQGSRTADDGLDRVDGDCAGTPASQQPMVTLRPAAPADGDAEVDAGIHVNTTADDRPCVDMYVWSTARQWKAVSLTVTATDDWGREWSLSGGLDEVNDASLVMSAGTRCVRFIGEVVARREGEKAVWRAAGESRACS